MRAREGGEVPDELSEGVGAGGDDLEGYGRDSGMEEEAESERSCGGGEGRGGERGSKAVHCRPYIAEYKT